MRSSGCACGPYRPLNRSSHDSVGATRAYVGGRDADRAGARRRAADAVGIVRKRRMHGDTMVTHGAHAQRAGFTTRPNGVGVVIGALDGMRRMDGHIRPMQCCWPSWLMPITGGGGHHAVNKKKGGRFK